jgi:hypothetical protein
MGMRSRRAIGEEQSGLWTVEWTQYVLYPISDQSALTGWSRECYTKSAEEGGRGPAAPGLG